MNGLAPPNTSTDAGNKPGQIQGGGRGKQETDSKLILFKIS